MTKEISFKKITNLTHLMLAQKCDDGDGVLRGSEIDIFNACKKSFKGLSPDERKKLLAQKKIDINSLSDTDKNWARLLDMGENPTERCVRDGKLTGREIKNFYDATKPDVVEVGGVTFNINAVKNISKSDDETYDYKITFNNEEELYFVKQGANRRAKIDSAVNFGVWDTVVSAEGFIRKGQNKNSVLFNGAENKRTQVIFTNSAFDDINSGGGHNRVFILSSSGKSSIQSTVQGEMTTVIAGGGFNLESRDPRDILEFANKRMQGNEHSYVRYNPTKGKAVKNVNARDITVNNSNAIHSKYEELSQKIAKKMKNPRYGNKKTGSLKNEIQKYKNELSTQEYNMLLQELNMQQSTNTAAKF